MDNSQNIATLDQLLKHVNYKTMFDGYVPTDAALKFINFIKLVNGGSGEENKTPLIHYLMADDIFNYKNILHVASRGIGKTAINGEYRILYIGFNGGLDGFGAVTSGIYVSDTMDNGVKSMRKNLEHRYNSSPFLRQYMDAKFTDSQWDFENKAGVKTSFHGYGVTTGIRGAKEFGVRPTVAILDDLMSDKNSESPTVVSDIENVIYSAIRQALHPNRRKVIWVGTPFNQKDPLYKAASSGAFNTRVLPICNDFPCSKKDFVGAWEDRFSYEMLTEEYNVLKKAGKTEAFYSQLMLRVTSNDDKIIQDDDVRWYDRKDVTHHMHKYHFYITTDFAVTEKQSSDYTVISVWAYDWDNNWFFVDGVLEQQTMEKTVDDIFRLVSIYHPLSVGIEVSGQQKGFVDWLNSEKRKRSIWFNIASDKTTHEEGFRPNTSKLARFNAVVPQFKQGKIHFPTSMKDSKIVVEATNELSSVTKSGFKSLHDDFCDTVSQLVLLHPIAPSKEVEQKVELIRDNSIFNSIYLTNYDDSGNVLKSYIV